MGLNSTKEQSIVTAIETHDSNSLRTVLKDSTIEEIQALCKALVSVGENQCTLLHYATWQDNAEMLAPLLDYADDLEVLDDLGWTPLMTAINRGSKQSVAMLLARGAKIDCDQAGGLSLMADAMNHQDAELIALLMDHGAQVSPTPAMLADDNEQKNFYLLHYAVDDGLLDIAKILLERGKISINMLDQSGWSALHLAAGHNNLEMLKLLLDNGADVNIRDSEGNTPLAWAKEMNATEVINELERRGGIADKEWHGEKLELKTNEERIEEQWTQGEYVEDFEGQQWQQTIDGGAYDQFEIEVENTESKSPYS